jgi:hypothetical protein
MTASSMPGEPAERPAGEAGAGPAAPDDAEQLQAEVERTREQLGEAVEQLAAKADVTSRARDGAARLTGQIKSATAQGAGAARQHGVPLTVAALVLIAGYLLIRQWRKR